MLFVFNTGKTHLASFDWFNSTDAIDVKMDGFVLEEKSSLRMLGLTFSSKLDNIGYWIRVMTRHAEPNINISF